MLDSLIVSFMSEKTFFAFFSFSPLLMAIRKMDLSEGKIYTATMELLTDGCVLLHNTPRHLKVERMDTKNIKIENPKGSTT